MAQIDAVEKAGLKEWIFWNPTNIYDLHKYRLAAEVPVPVVSPPVLPTPEPSLGPVVTPEL
jgi:hypothetical protein